MDSYFGFDTIKQAKTVCHLLNLEESNDFKRVLESQPFSKKIEVFCPSQDPNNGLRLFSDFSPLSEHFYYMPSFNLSNLFDENFRTSTFGDDEPCGISIHRLKEVDDLVEFQNGQMFLSVHKDTFTKLGLSSSKSLNNQLISGSPVSLRDTLPSLVQIDIKNPSIKREKIESAMKTLSPVDLVLCLESLDDCNLMRSSDIDFPEMIQHQKLYNKIENFNLRHINIPVISLDHLYDTNLNSIKEIELQQFLEWMGFIHNRIRNIIDNKNIDPNIANIHLDSLEMEQAFGIVSTHEGLFTPTYTQHLFAYLYSLVSRGLVPWIFFTAWGFEESISTLGTKRDCYSILILPNKFYITLTSN